MKLPNIPMPLFFGFGCFAFVTQALMNTILYFINLAGHNVFSSISTWTMILFNCMVAYLFFTLYQDETIKQTGVLDDFDPKTFVDTHLKGDQK